MKADYLIEKVMEGTTPDELMEFNFLKALGDKLKKWKPRKVFGTYTPIVVDTDAASEAQNALKDAKVSAKKSTQVVLMVSTKKLDDALEALNNAEIEYSYSVPA